MIKPLIKVISENRNTGCYSPPPLKEISFRDLRRRGARNDERCIDCIARRTVGRS
jgi:hypothetical protein